MPRNSDEGKWIVMGIVVLMAIAAAILISRMLFPIFLIGTVISLIVLIFMFISEMRSGYESYGDDSIIYVGIAFGVCLIGTGITYGIGYGIGNSPIGELSLQVHGAVTGVQQELDNSINQAIDESCKSLPQENCQLMRNAVNTFRTVQDVTDFADKLRTAKKVVDKISK